jgi:hypothetical protein
LSRHTHDRETKDSHAEMTPRAETIHSYTYNPLAKLRSLGVDIDFYDVGEILGGPRTGILRVGANEYDDALGPFAVSTDNMLIACCQIVGSGSRLIVVDLPSGTRVAERDGLYEILAISSTEIEARVVSVRGEVDGSVIAIAYEPRGS